jgi:UDP-glucuronate 4-epimerase
LSAGQRVLLTGGAGFLGYHVARELLRRGCALTIVDNLDPFYPREVKQANLDDLRREGAFEFVAADIADAPAMRELVVRARPERVIHLAARPGVRASFENPAGYHRANVTGTVNVLEAVRLAGAVPVVFASSSSVYGACPRRPFSEAETALEPLSPYASSKLAAEVVARSYALSYGIPVTCLRLFTVYGPRQRPDLAIHKFARQIEAGQPVPIFGDGSSARDYTFVGDTVRGVLAALDRTPGEPFEIFNLGSSRPVTLAELVAHLERLMGRKAEVRREPARPEEPHITWADIAKAERELGYAPRTPLEDGLREFLAWFGRRARAV